ncbi:3-dehydroquinate synthase [Acidovorax sp. 56]|uniref:3-dehydroquinate synthase n=1 Tax=Acidovorax sp. 56 TaxID=2035205 RepID=UPI000C16D4E4|nr:3-dehydroquinate synthase [Acidovorax sp. 56]PIF27281.1 3-dehydroquinate synthase [Acidovorax sp. 56]
MYRKFSSVCVGLEGRSYLIEICQGFFDAGDDFYIPSGSSALIVTNDIVSPIYTNLLIGKIDNKFSNVLVLVLQDGESQKNWNSLSKIFDCLLENGCDRKAVIFALGGGVIGDMAGFAASTYMRGIPFVQVPTTLLAQVDSSVGGKTAINHPLGKNMIGSFYQPQLVICDVDTLDTLPAREMSAGMAEVIKYAPIYDADFMDWLESSMDGLMAKDHSLLAYAIKRCCEIKALVVAEDERESGLRAILNFGHTFGHAIETGMGYGVWLHGEGVAAGMVMAAELSRRLGMLDAAFVERLKALIQRAGLPIKGPVIDPKDNAGRYLELMRIDKKSEAGEIRFVLIDGPGKAVVRPAPDALVREVIDACCA